MKFKYYGHSCFSVVAGGKTLLFDPFIRPNPLASKIDFDKVNPDYIFISHGHFDHIADAEDIARRSNAVIIANFEITEWLAQKGLTNEMVAMNIGGRKKFDWGSVKMVIALHSSTLPDGSSGGFPVGFIIESDEAEFYYAGDTGLSVEFQLISDFSDLDFAVLPIGDVFTMGYEDAAICAEFIDCDRIIGVHYDTYPPIKLDRQAALDQFEEVDKELILLEIGEERDI